MLLNRAGRVCVGALTTAFAVSLECLCLAECLRRKLGGLECRYLRDCFLRIIAASLAMGIPLFFVARQFAKHFPATRAAYWTELTVEVPLGLLLFFLAGRLFGVPEIGLSSYLSATPFWHRLAGTRAKI